MAKFLPIHRSRILSEVTVARTKLEPGQMIKFRYKKKNGDADLYMALVLSLWPPAAGIREKVMHAITLDQVSDNTMRRLIRVIGSPAIDDNVPTKNGKQSTKFILPKGRSAPQRFYDVKLDTIPELIKKGYRTYHLREMTQVRLIDYDFSKFISPRFFGEDADSPPDNETMDEKVEKTNVTTIAEQALQRRQRRASREIDRKKRLGEN